MNTFDTTPLRSWYDERIIGCYINSFGYNTCRGVILKYNVYLLLYYIYLRFTN